MDTASGVYLHITDSSFITGGASSLITVIPMITVKGKIGLNDVSATTFKDILGYDLSYNSNYDGLSRILEQVSHAYVWRLNQNAKLANAYFASTTSEKEFNPDAETFEDVTRIEPAPILSIAHKDVGDWETAAVRFVPTDDVDTITNENATSGTPQIINLENINVNEKRELFGEEVFGGCVFYNSSDNSVVGIIKKDFNDLWKVYRVVDGEIIDDILETDTVNTNAWTDGTKIYNGSLEEMSEPQGDKGTEVELGKIRLASSSGKYYQDIHEEGQDSAWYEVLRLTPSEILTNNVAEEDSDIIAELTAATDITISYVQYSYSTTSIKEVRAIGSVEINENNLNIILTRTMSTDTYWSVHTLPATLVNWTLVYATSDGRNYSIKGSYDFSFDVESDIYIDNVDFGDIQISATQSFPSTWTTIREYITLEGGSNGDKALSAVDIDTTQLDECPTRPNVVLMNGLTDFRVVNRLGNKCHKDKIHLFADIPAYSSYADAYAWSKKILQSEYVAIAARPDQELDSKKKTYYVYPSVNYAKIFANMLSNFGSLCYPPAGATYGAITANDLLKCDYANFANEMKTYRMNWQLSDANGTVMWEQRTTYSLNTDLSYIAPVFIVDDLSDQLISYERIFNFRYTSKTDLLNQESGITDILDGFVNKGFISRYVLNIPSYEEAQKAGRTLTIKIGVAIAKDSEVINIELELLSA